MFRGAVRGDLPQILQIYAHAREAMAASGNPTQWGDNFPPQELLEEDIDSNRLFVYVVNGQLLGVFAFILGVDSTYQVIEDGAWLNDTLPYGTIHRLASSGKSKGVASAVIEWCLEHCQSLRADTHADNQIMQHLLEKNGFTRCGIIQPKTQHSTLCPEGPAPGQGVLFLSSKLQNCILCKYSFRGEKIKVHKNWKTREKNAWKYFLFWAVCAIMTLVLE